MLQDADPMTLATSFAFVAAPLVYYRVTNYFSSRNKPHPLAKVLAKEGSKIKPPFPQEVRSLLAKCNLAYLSTVDQSLASSHLSLMRFTYLNDPDDGEVVIMSTNKETKKYDMLQQQKGVALLIHDFGDSSTSGQFSITLNGTCRIVSDSKKAEEYRRAHLKHNPEYPQFIVGDHIAILCVDVKSARICNINDQVVKWDVSEAPATNSEEFPIESSLSENGQPKVTRI